MKKKSNTFFARGGSVNESSRWGHDTCPPSEGETGGKRVAYVNVGLSEGGGRREGAATKKSNTAQVLLPLTSFLSLGKRVKNPRKRLFSRRGGEGRGFTLTTGLQKSGKAVYEHRERKAKRNWIREQAVQ